MSTGPQETQKNTQRVERQIQWGTKDTCTAEIEKESIKEKLSTSSIEPRLNVVP